MTDGGFSSYYGFPSHYYKVQYPNTGSKEISGRILNLLKEKGIKAGSKSHLVTIYSLLTD